MNQESKDDPSTPARSERQRQTEDAFGYKWKKRDSYEGAAMQAEWRRWLLEKYFDGDAGRIAALLGTGPKRVLDAGCGSGGSALALFGDALREHKYTGVDISEAADVCRERFGERGIPGSFIRCSLEAIPASCGSFDVIFSEGVLHHTDSVRDAIASLGSRLERGGRFLFYVYVKKAPIREFTDDLVREAIAGMGNDEAWDALMPLTELGRKLGELDVEIEIDSPIPFLGIPAGRVNLQRLFYYRICKAYYRHDYTLEEMNHINFDWFRPKNCHRHTPEEIGDFCAAAGLDVLRFHVEDSGITVIATKP
jgi:arsenite methyltransferase